MSHLPFLVTNPDDSMYERLELERRAAEATPSLGAERPAEKGSKRAASKKTVAKTTGSGSPSLIAFPIAVLIALGTSALLYTLTAELTNFELSTISRNVDEPLEIGALLGWRIAELLINWELGFDYWDTASLYLLTNAPYYILLPLFYKITPVAVLISLVIDVFSSSLPFCLLRSLNKYNDASPSSTLTSPLVKLLITIFSSVTYATALYGSLQTFLPAYVIGNFDNVRSLEAAHSASYVFLLTLCLPLGNAAKDFLFSPSTWNAKADVVEIFDPERATLSETLAYNIGLSSWGKREDVLVGRTLLVAGLTIGNSVMKIYWSVEGAELRGAVGWGAIIAASHALAGAGVGYIGDV